MNIKSTMLNFLYYYFKIFGIGPLTVKFIKLSQTNNFQWVLENSKIGFMYNILSSCTLIVFTIIYYSYFHSDKKIKIISLFDMGKPVFTFCIVIILLRFCIKPRELFSVINKFDDINKLRIGSPVIINSVSSIIFISAIQLLKIVYRCWLESPNYHSMVKIGLMMFIDTWKKLVNNSVLMQCSFVLQLIGNHVAFMNGEMMNTLKPSIFASDIDLQRRFDKFMCLHGFLYDLSKKLSNYYSLPMLVCTVYIFTSTIKHSYLFLQYLLSVEDFQGLDLINIFILILPLFWLTANVSSVLNEVC